MISHGILPILPPDFTEFACFLADIKNLASVYKTRIFLTFSQNGGKEKFAQGGQI